MTMVLRLKRSHWDKYYYTFYLLINGVTWGIGIILFPLIMTDMQYVLDTTKTWVSLHQTIETIGYCLGALVPLLYRYKYLNRQLMIAVFVIFMAIAGGVTPLVPSLWLLYICAFIVGFGGAIHECGVAPWAFELWQTKCAPVIQFNAFTFAAGNVMTSVILKPYITGDNDPDGKVDRRAKLTLPIVMISVFVIAVSLLSLVMYFIKPYKAPVCKDSSTTEAIGSADEKIFDNERTPKKWIRVLFAFWYTFYVTLEITFIKFAFTYFQQLDGLDSDDHNDLFILSTSVFALFRLLNVFISMKMPSLYIIIFQYIILLIASVMFIVSLSYHPLIWIASPVMCWGLSSMFAAIYTYTGENLTMSNQVGVLFLVVRGIFTLFTPMIFGPLIEDYAYIFVIVCLGYLFVSIVLFALIQYLIKKYKRILSETQMKS